MVAKLARGRLVRGCARTDSLSHLRAHKKGAEAWGTSRHDMASHGGGHGHPVQVSDMAIDIPNEKWGSIRELPWIHVGC